MRKIVGRLVLPILVGALLAGCVTTGGDMGKGVDPEAAIAPLIDVAARKMELAAVPANERGRWCKEAWPTPNMERRATTSGPIEFQASNAQRAGNALFGLVEAYYAGRRRAAKDIRDALERGASIDAFTVLVAYRPAEFPGYNEMNEPIFQVANFLVPLAHAYLIVQHEFADEEALLTDIKRWGDRLFQVTNSGRDDFIGVVRGVDRRAHISAGWAYWGNAANNRAALARAYRYYVYSLVGIGEGGVDRIWIDFPPDGGTRLSHINSTLQGALVAAHALRRSGASDVYTIAPGGGTVIEGLAWLWDEIEEKRPLEILAFPRHDGSKSIAWVELFVHEFPDHPSAKHMDEWLSKKGALHVNMGGGPTTCLYGRVTPEA
ncbi:MAG: hypothetical protein OXD31_12415 [Chloroflexi bacterium]|nr:hypothetical protein [Chloroflexota bacterium]